MRALASVGLFLLAGCWASFPESRLNKDGSTSGPDSYWPPTPDLGVPVDSRRPRDLFRPPVDSRMTCTPLAFIRCATNHSLERCNNAGTGTTVISCGSSQCRADLGRCDQCDPGEPGQCSGTDLIHCSPDGLRVRMTCPLGCNPSTNACCVDSDGDKVTDCAGDCDESDVKVFPGQTAFICTPRSNGSFDYNCDQVEDPAHPDIVHCVSSGGSCTGNGWMGPFVPKCGEVASFGTCKRKGGLCQPEPNDMTQCCR
jgi:hypothetical protein